MKPILFAKDETDFTTNGLGRLDCISCSVIEERNGMYELEAEIPITGAHASEIEQLSIIGVVPHDGGNVQAFVVYKITKPINGRFHVYARHISYRLTDIPCEPFSVEAGPNACSQTFVGFKNHALESCPFTFWTDNTTAAPYVQKIPASIRQRMGGIEGSVIDQFGGEYEWDNWTVKLHNVRGRLANVTGITLRYGKNITDINQEEEIASTVTGIVPFWADGEGNNLVMIPSPNTVIYSDKADNFPYHLTQVLDFSSNYQEQPTPAQLLAAGQTYVTKSDFGVPKVSIKVSFVDLWKTEEYKDIAPLERVQLCDEVTVIFEKLGVSAIAKVVKTNYDVLKERYISIEIGSIRTTLAQAVTDRDKNIDTTFMTQMARVVGVVNSSTAWLTNAKGYVVAVKNTDGSWKELLFMNTNNPQTATQGLRINNAGIGFWDKAYDGGNVLDGPYGMAWTIDGRLGDFANKNFWNFRTGGFSLSAGTTVGGKTVDTIAQEKASAAQAAAENTAAAALAAQVAIYDADIVDLQNQIDGNVTTWYYSGTPTLNNLPASQWTTTTDKDNHIGDIYYDSATGYAYRFMKDGNNYIWTKISDSDIEAALSEAQDAWDLADNKRRVFITQPVPPYDIGDLWVQGSNGDIKRCASNKETGEVFDANDWVLASKYTDDSAVTALDNSLDQDEVFKRLTNNRANQGIYLDPNSGDLYVNASMLGVGIIKIGGGNAEYTKRPQIEVYDTDGTTVVGTWSRDGIVANKGQFGILHIDRGTGPDYEDASIYAGTYREYIYEEEYPVRTKQGYSEIFYINPYKMGFTEDTSIGVFFGVDAYYPESYTPTAADLNQSVAVVYLDKRTSLTGNYTQIGSASYKLSEQGMGKEILDSYGRTLMLDHTFGQNLGESYRVRAYFDCRINSGSTVYRSYIDKATFVVHNTEEMAGVKVSLQEVIGNFKGGLVGSADLYSLKCGNVESDGDGLTVNSGNGTGNGVKVYNGSNNIEIYTTSTDANIAKHTSTATYIPQWSQVSDRRLKDNIEPLNLELSKALIDGSEPIKFNYIEDKGKHYGMIAQDVRKQLDSLGEKDAQLEFIMNIPKDMQKIPDQRAICYEEYTPHMINYLQYLNRKSEEQEEKIKELEDIINVLQNRYSV